jgi:hypothetical protein
VLTEGTSQNSAGRLPSRVAVVVLLGRSCACRTHTPKSRPAPSPPRAAPRVSRHDASPAWPWGGVTPWAPPRPPSGASPRPSGTSPCCGCCWRPPPPRPRRPPQARAPPPRLDEGRASISPRLALAGQTRRWAMSGERTAAIDGLVSSARRRQGAPRSGRGGLRPSAARGRATVRQIASPTRAMRGVGKGAIPVYGRVGAPRPHHALLPGAHASKPRATPEPVTCPTPAASVRGGENGCKRGYQAQWGRRGILRGFLGTVP